MEAESDALFIVSIRSIHHIPALDIERHCAGATGGSHAVTPYNSRGAICPHLLVIYSQYVIISLFQYRDAVFIINYERVTGDDVITYRHQHLFAEIAFILGALFLHADAVYKSRVGSIVAIGIRATYHRSASQASGRHVATAHAEAAASTRLLLCCDSHELLSFRFGSSHRRR